MELKELIEQEFETRRPLLSRKKVDKLLNVFETVEDDISSGDLSQHSLSHLNNIAKIALKLCVAFELETDLIKQILAYFWPLIRFTMKLCRRKSIQAFDAEKHGVTKAAKLPRILSQNFERVKAESIFEATSISLFGDGSAIELLRLVTLVTFLQHKAVFENQIENSPPDATNWHQPETDSFEALLESFLGSDVTLNYYHLVALSAAIRTPFYLYGSFEQFRREIVGLAPDPAQSPYDTAKAVYEELDADGHYRFCGLKADDSGRKEAVCLFGIDEKVSCTLLPREGVQEVSWRPKNLAGHYLDAKPKPTKPKKKPKKVVAAAVVDNEKAEVAAEAVKVPVPAPEGIPVQILAQIPILEQESALPLLRIPPPNLPILLPKASGSNNRNSCPKCQSKSDLDKETCMGICNDCGYIFCIHCRRDYHGNSSLITCEMTESDKERMIEMHKESAKSKSELFEKEKIKAKDTKDAKEDKKVEKEQIIEDLPFVSGRFGPDGTYRFDCKICKSQMALRCEAVEPTWALLTFEESVAYFRCRCPGFVRLQKKKIEKWVKKGKKDVFTKSFNRNKYFAESVLKIK